MKKIKKRHMLQNVVL